MSVGISEATNNNATDNAAIDIVLVNISSAEAALAASVPQMSEGRISSSLALTSTYQDITAVGRNQPWITWNPSPTSIFRIEQAGVYLYGQEMYFETSAGATFTGMRAYLRLGGFGNPPCYTQTTELDLSDNNHVFVNSSTGQQVQTAGALAQWRANVSALVGTATLNVSYPTRCWIVKLS